MTNKEVFRKALEQAKENGYINTTAYRWDSIDKNDVPSEITYPVIFSHDFARALWGEDEYAQYTDGEFDHYIDKAELPEDEFKEWWRTYIVRWQELLKVMVLQEDPVRYLERFLTN